MERLYKITEVTKKYNITVRTLRFYEGKGLISSVRSEGYAYRMYTWETLQRLEQILFFRKLDISLKDIIKILRTNTREQISEIISEKQYQIDHQIEKLNKIHDTVLYYVSELSNKTVPVEKLTAGYKITIAENIDFKTLISVSVGSSGKEVVKESCGNTIFLRDGNLIINDFEKHAVIKEIFGLPVTINVIAKTNNENLRLYFGLLELIFNWEVNNDLLVFNDLKNNIFLSIPGKGAIEKNSFVNIFWNISPHNINCTVEGRKAFDIGYTGASGIYPSEFGIGTKFGNTVTVKSVTVHTSSAVKSIDLSRFSLQKISYHFNDGNLVVQHMGDSERMITAKKYSLPLIIDAVAMTSDENLRLFFAGGSVILNWERKSLYFKDPYSGEEFSFEHIGYISPNEFHDIRQIFTKNYYALIIDGSARLILENLPYMKALRSGIDVSGSIGVSSAFSNIVTVSSIKVSFLEEEKEELESM